MPSVREEYRTRLETLDVLERKRVDIETKLAAAQDELARARLRVAVDTRHSLPSDAWKDPATGRTNVEWAKNVVKAHEMEDPEVTRLVRRVMELEAELRSILCAIRCAERWVAYFRCLMLVDEDLSSRVRELAGCL